MYEVYQKLLDEKGLKNADTARATGISNMTLSDWKRGKSVPKSDKMQKIADYFGVSVEYLTKVEESKFSKDRAILEVQITDDEALMNRLKKYMELPQEKKDLILNMIDNL